ncbi:class I adenylate-forming enzyme family protein [Actinokineospora auranticolor]|uniref:Acyl-CoA synthetase (AMP-forming)/AMP-acid ligase II n=1 Tax=Actinokineospora auranticolor TaxID=155976 RepID=A0A2S6GKC7_9PSEU|nr:class I adenylate-forming enzyme family protein [Actinokineospora auranticolor]PPK65669.1 acyl-CoA synthetase (AMP-forming)/AMP-acid ligase II [Actinokineospora auranticolor]
MTTFAPTVLTAEQRAAVAADATIGGGNLLPSAIAASPAPDQPFLRTLRPVINTAGEPQEEFSLLELDELVQSWSVWYLGQGVGPRDRVAIWIEDSFAYSVHLYALAQIGAIAVLINTKASREIAESLIKQTTPMGIYANRPRMDVLADLTANLPGLAWTVLVEDVPAPPKAELPADQRFRHNDEDPITILHSSGTTGLPKPTIHTHGSLVAGPKFRLVDHKELPGAMTMTSLPQSHLGCIAYSVYAVLAGARTTAGFDRPGAELVEAVATHKPTAVMSFAHAYSEIPSLDMEPGAIDSVNVWVSIGDAVHEAHIKDILRKRGADKPQAAFFDRLGTTELGWGVLLKIRTVDTERNDRCAGKPVGVAEVTILRADGTYADDNEVGLLAARGPAITPGYWDNHDLNYRSRLSGYWLTGDNGYRDGNGDHFLVDRTVDALVTPERTGYSVFMEEVLLADVPDVVDTAVVAGRRDGVVVPVAVVVPAPGTDPDPVKLLTLANEELARAGHLTLGALDLARTDEDFPVGVTGKVLKRNLRDKYADLAAYGATADPKSFAALES